jgi:uncharacterized membrane protein YeaQ/YmgE (transglycosylase-associated protein family)
MVTINLNGNTFSFDLLTLLWWLIVGLVAGLLANAITQRRSSIIGDIFLGIVGAFVGGLVLGLLGLQAYGLLGTLVAATIGAILVILLVSAFFPQRRHRRTY